MIYVFGRFFFFFFNDTATTEIYTLSLHDALPILRTSWLSAASIPISNNLGFFIPSPDDRQLRATIIDPIEIGVSRRPRRPSQQWKDGPPEGPSKTPPRCAPANFVPRTLWTRSAGPEQVARASWRRVCTDLQKVANAAAARRRPIPASRPLDDTASDQYLGIIRLPETGRPGGPRLPVCRKRH